jgi:NDP-sugar pyrophosphorylase family protein
MRNLSEIVKAWPVVNGWSVAPEDTAFCVKGTRLMVGNGVKIGNWANIGDEAKIGNWANIGDEAKIGDGANIGDEAKIGDGAADPINLGFADGFSCHLAQVDGVAFIGGGCKWLNVTDAITYVTGRSERAEMLDRVLYAATIADRLGWKRS